MHATTLARIDVEIRCDGCTRVGQTAVEYRLFVRVSESSGPIVTTSELIADGKFDSKPSLTAHLDVPLAPGTYQLATATKNSTTGDAGTPYRN
jgi:hypothetical protein